MLRKIKNIILIMLVGLFIISSFKIEAFSINKNYIEKEIINVFNDRDLNKDEELYSKFNNLVHDLFDKRNKSVLIKDAEALKQFYDLKIKVSLWAYESEIKKIKYLTNWSEKQGVNFSDIKSKIKLKKVKEKEKGLYGVICTVSTEFTYNYLNEPEKSNMFRLGTQHYLNLKEDGDRYIITKEWYTDPFADSLDLNNIKSNEIKEYISKKEYPSNYAMNERTKKAMEYAHKYCGAAADEEFDFKYNGNYTDFNPQGGDCANFASQILHEGAGFKKNDAWNYYNGNGSKAWVNAQGFKNYMVGSGRASYIAKGTYQKVYKAAYNMRPGDFVAYEKKGRVVHISTVTGLDSKGYPLVTCHNTDRCLVPYDLGWSNNNITFHLIHVHY